MQNQIYWIYSLLINQIVYMSLDLYLYIFHVHMLRFQCGTQNEYKVMKSELSAKRSIN